MRIILAATLALTLTACGGGDTDSESADDFAERLGGPAAPDAEAERAVSPVQGSQAHLPQAASDGRKAIRPDVVYTNTLEDGSQRGLSLSNDGSFTLVEDGQTIGGNYEWLPDGRRLRLKGVETNPIVVVADGTLYRVLNEDVPLNDVGPERMYSAPAAAAAD